MNEQKTILVIDDSELLLTWTRDVLQSAGYRVVVANNVFAARQLAEDKPDLLLMDVQFANALQEGVAATKSLKREEDLSDIPIILYSALAEDILIALATDSGANGYICKTDDSGLLVQHVTYFLSECDMDAAERS